MFTRPILWPYGHMGGLEGKGSLKKKENKTKQISLRRTSTPPQPLQNKKNNLFWFFKGAYKV